MTDKRLSRAGLCLLVLAAGVLVLSACGDSDSSSGRYGEQDPEYKLAAIDTHGAPEDSQVLPYERALDALERRCGDKRERIADFSVNATRLLERENSLAVSNLAMLRGVEKALAKRSTELASCSKAFATLAVLINRESRAR